MKTKTILLIGIVTLLFAFINQNPNPVTITGKITNPNGTYVAFKGKDTTYVTTLNKDGTFEITFTLNSSKYLNFKHGVEHTAMYVKPGDKIYLTIDPNQFDESITYEGSETSSFLAKLALLRENADFYVYGKEYYLGSPDEYKMKLEELKAELFYEFKTINDRSFIKVQKAGIDKFLSRYIRMQEDLSKYEKNVRILMFERAEIDKRYDFDAAIYSLNSEQFSVMLKEYSDAISSWLSKMTDNDAFKNANEQRLQRDIKWWREKKINIDNVPKEGEPAIDFNYADKDGNEFSLSSFKGRLVYIDVWATWCGPCIVEIPALKKLEEEYQDKKISFVSISQDKDKEAWLKMLDEKELGGIQLWAGDLWEANSIIGIAKDYAIYGIPRFMLFSADGKVISTNAPRPSTIEIKGLLDSNLELMEEE